MAACERECVAARALRAAATHRVRARVLHKAVVRQRPQKRRVPRVLKVHRACVGGAGGAAGARSGGRARGDLSDPRAQAPRSNAFRSRPPRRHSQACASNAAGFGTTKPLPARFQWIHCCIFGSSTRFHSAVRKALAIFKSGRTAEGSAAARPDAAVTKSREWRYTRRARVSSAPGTAYTIEIVLTEKPRQV